MPAAPRAQAARGEKEEATSADSRISNNGSAPRSCAWHTVGMKTLHPIELRVLAAIGLLSVLASCATRPAVLGEKKNDDRHSVLSVDSKAIKRGKIRSSVPATLEVVLPRSYSSEPSRRYPVVYALHGFGDGARSMIAALRAPLEAAAADGSCPEAILVAVEGGNVLGGAFYLNSAATGDWMDLVAEEAVAVVDARYRTVRSPKARMLAGYSMGGFGAWNIALARPDVFSYAWAACPGAWDENGLADTLKGWNSVYRTAYGAATAPDLAAAHPFARIPRLDGSEEDRVVREAWEKGFGDARAKVAAYARGKAKLGEVRIDFGEKDTYAWIPRGSAFVARAMEEGGVRAAAVGHPCGHIVSDSMVREGFVPLVARAFSPAAE